LTHLSLPFAFFLQIDALKQTLPPQLEGSPEPAKLNLVLNRNAPSVTSLFEDVIESLNAREMCGNKK
jgi:hypothetical protein